jgi:hypothetical protein
MIIDEHRKHIAAMMHAYGISNLIANELVGIVHPNKAEMMENILNPIHRELVVDSVEYYERGLLMEINDRISAPLYLQILKSVSALRLSMVLGHDSLDFRHITRRILLELSSFLTFVRCLDST